MKKHIFFINIGGGIFINNNIDLKVPYSIEENKIKKNPYIEMERFFSFFHNKTLQPTIDKGFRMMKKNNRKIVFHPKSLQPTIDKGFRMMKKIFTIIFE